MVQIMLRKNSVKVTFSRVWRWHQCGLKWAGEVGKMVDAYGVYYVVFHVNQGDLFDRDGSEFL